MFSLGVIGSSKMPFYVLPYIQQSVTNIIELEVDKPIDEVEFQIISGGATGIDSIIKKIATDNGWNIKEFLPKHKAWDYYRLRNIDIAKYSNHIVCYAISQKSSYCYHCNLTGHCRTGGCWTAKYARNHFKKTAYTLRVAL